MIPPKSVFLFNERRNPRNATDPSNLAAQWGRGGGKDDFILPKNKTIYFGLGRDCHQKKKKKRKEGRFIFGKKERISNPDILRKWNLPSSGTGQEQGKKGGEEGRWHGAMPIKRMEKGGGGRVHSFGKKKKNFTDF